MLVFNNCLHFLKCAVSLINDLKMALKLKPRKLEKNYVKNHNDLSIRNDIQFEEKNFVNVISAS